MPIPRRLRMHTDGKSSSVNASVFTMGKITGLPLGLSDFITSLAHSELGWEDEKKRRPHYVARLRLQDSKDCMKLRFGVTASKRGLSATSMIAFLGCIS